MSCEQNARMVLGYLESEESVLKNMKEALESQLMRLQIDEMNLRLAYQNAKKKAGTKKEMKVKKEPEVKMERKLPTQMINSHKERLELKPLQQGSISQTERKEELPELLLEPYHMDPFSQINGNEELPELLLEPIKVVSFSNPKIATEEILELSNPNSEENSMENSEGSLTTF